MICACADAFHPLTRLTPQRSMPRLSLELERYAWYKAFYRMTAHPSANAIPRERDAPLFRGTTSRVREETRPAPRGTTARISAGPPRTLRDLGQEPSKVEDDPENDVDMNNDASDSDFDHTRVDENDEVNTSVSFTTQQEARRLQVETATTSENTEAAGFGSDTSPRTESGDYEELSQAETN